MTDHWGVDSWVSSNQPAPGGRFFFDSVAAAVGRQPAFWGRYLNNYSYALTKGEKEFLLGRNCRILLVFNGPERQPLTGPGAYDAGRRSAMAACGLARAIGIREGVRIFADLEGWPTDAGWFRGWCEIMVSSSYVGVGGIYGNAAASWSWGRNAGIGATDAVDRDFADLIDDIIAGRSTKSLDLHYWSTRPCLSQGQPLPPPSRVVPAAFNPRPAPLTPYRFTSITVWQYRQGVTGIHGGTVDLDLATDEGLGGMLSP